MAVEISPKLVAGAVNVKKMSKNRNIPTKIKLKTWFMPFVTSHTFVRAHVVSE